MLTPKVRNRREVCILSAKQQRLRPLADAPVQVNMWRLIALLSLLMMYTVRTIRKWDSQLHDEIKMGCALKDVLQRNDVGVLNSGEDKWMKSSSQTASLAPHS